MKKSAVTPALLLLATILSGCPLYGNDGGCSNCDHVGGDCPDGSPPSAQGECPAPGAGCALPSDCDANETCSKFGTCSTGDCHYESVGCVPGYVCSPDSGRWQCVPEGSLGGAAGAAGTAGAAGAAGAP